MKPASFRYIAARSIEEALAAKAEHGEDARFLAGGQSLVPAMNFRLVQPAVLIDLNPLAELAGIERADGARPTTGGPLIFAREEPRHGITPPSPTKCLPSPADCGISASAGVTGLPCGRPIRQSGSLLPLPS